MKGVTLNDKELVAKVREWVRNLAMSGGKDWSLQVPVNFEKDPDVLIEEVCKRFESLSAPGDAEGRDWIVIKEGCLMPECEKDEPYSKTVLTFNETGFINMDEYWPLDFDEHWTSSGNVTHWMPLPKSPTK